MTAEAPPPILFADSTGLIDIELIIDGKAATAGQRIKVSPKQAAD